MSRVNCRGAVGGGNGWRRGRRQERPGSRDWPGVGRLEGDGATEYWGGPGGALGVEDFERWEEL